MRVSFLGIVIAIAACMPAAVNADDQQIADFVKARLMQEKQQGNLYGFNVDMRVDKGTVWFKGFVSNRSQELLILRTAQLAGHLGVVQVVDDIDVNNPHAQGPASVMTQPVSNPQTVVAPPQRVAMNPMNPAANRGRTFNNQAVQTMSRPMQAVGAVQPQPQMMNQNRMQPGAMAPNQMKPQAPKRMKLPLSNLTEPKKDEITQKVAYQEAINQPLPNQGLDSVVVPGTQSETPNTQPSFQQSLMNTVPARQISTPISQPYAGANSVGTVPTASTPPVPVAGSPLPFARAAAPAQGCYDGSCGTYDGGVPMAGDFGGTSGFESGSANLPGYAWPAYAAHPNYGAVSYPKQYSASAWPYIGPFYPYPQVPLGWRKVALEWDDGWWYLDFNDKD